jgi:hypothetical protein
VKTIWQARLVDTTARYGELAPTATACCNACRTCVQTNVIAAVLAALAGASAFLAGRLRGLFKRR